VKPWTFMIYMAADNDLSPFAKANLNAMKNVLVDDVVNVIALADWPKASDTFTYRVRNGALEIIKRVPNIPSYEGPYLVSFVRDTMNAFPADNYCLVLWGHGDGIDWIYQNKVSPEGIFNDGRNIMPLAVLGAVFDGLAEAQIALLAFDACLMSMAEVYGQLKRSVDLAVGSTDEVPKAGFPYGEIFKHVLAQPGMGPTDLAKVIIDSYVDTYAHSKQPVSLSASQLGSSGCLASAVEELASSLTSRLQEPIVLKAIVDSRKKAEVSQEQSYVDLGSLCFGLLQSNLGRTSELADAVLTVLRQNYVLYRRGFPNNLAEHMSGVSVLFPLSLDARKERHQEGYRGGTLNAQVNWKAYRELNFSKDSNWDGFIEAFVATHPGNARRTN
jgi:hypothetical protein